MGMAASQARLLSLTARLTDNEMRSQMITNSKVRLADKSNEASAEYMKALNSTQIMFSSYNSDGERVYQEMTAGLINEYSPLKNQYGIINAKGKLLVKDVDAENYQNTDDLMGFLKAYDLVEETDAYKQYQKDLATYTFQMQTYTQQMATYKQQMTIYNTQMQAYLQSLNSPDLYELFSGVVGKSDDPKICYKNALNGTDSCYLHLLNYLLEYNGGSLSYHTFNTSITDLSGKQIQVITSTSGGWMDSTTAEEKDVMKQISQAINSEQIYLCDGKDVGCPEGQDSYNILEQKKNSNQPITDYDRLVSDWKEDGNGGYEKKSLKQKAIDAYYLIKNKSNFNIDAAKMREMLINFTDGDMQKLTLPEPTAPTAPIAPIAPSMPMYTMSVKDKDMAQWYANLWFMMNGSETGNLIKTNEVVYNLLDGGSITQTIHTIANVNKDITKSNYEVLEDNLTDSASWLKFALENGVVTLDQVTFTDPSEDYGKTPESSSAGITWKSIIYTSAPDYKEQDDELAITKAEVKYNKTLREIQYKDKEYDQDLKKLDSEHSALQTEYDSLKQVIQKNQERSFKTFS